MAQLLAGKTLMKWENGSGRKVDAAQQLEGKVVAIYFSAHWCPPCRAFTPLLKEFYENLSGKPFEVIFVSSDRSEDDLKRYMTEAHGNWCYIPFGDSTVAELKDKYSVEGIPTLIVIKSNGDIIVKNARSTVQAAKVASEVLDEWKKSSGL